MRPLLSLLIVLAAAPVAAQIQFRPTDPPIVTAVNESWYQLQEPIQFAGDLYYPAGARVFFNGNSMVRTGHYNGVPLYADTTVEPYSIVLVPIGSGQLQPYERLRRGELAGTTGSRPPSFPVRLVPDVFVFPGAAIAPTSLPQPIGAISVFSPPPLRSPAGPAEFIGGPVATTAATPAPAAIVPTTFATLLRPENNDGIWISFQGERFVMAGPAVTLVADEFELAGRYSGFPVFVRRGQWNGVIYLPTTGGLIVPYRLK